VTDPVAAAIAATSAALGREVRDLGGLGGSDRSHVHRVTDGTNNFVVKGYGAGSRTSWARERVGVGAAGRVGVAPRLLAAPADPPLVVMEDLGSAPSVADHLLGTDPAAAGEALVAWAVALGRLHAGTHAGQAAMARSFADAEAEAVAAGDDPVDRFDAGVGGSLDKATAEWDTVADELGIPGPPDVAALAAALAVSDHHALSPADTCPDNNLLLEDGCRLIDFEWSEVRHPAWDAAYLSVPWPTCWCSWRIPDAPAERALDAYREAAADGIPYVASDAFADDVAAARACWALVSVSWSLMTAIGADSVPTPRGPATRPRMQHRLGLVAHSGTAAASFAAEVLEHTRQQWGDLALALAPAYR
jgi:hypothetical protein